MGDIPKYYGKRRSIVRRIGSLLPLKPPPKIYVSVTPLHSMTSSMIDEESSADYRKAKGSNDQVKRSKPDLLEPISFGSEVRLLALEQELQDLREQISMIVRSNKTSKYASTVSLTNGDTVINSPPIPPPLPPTTPHIARRASLQDHNVNDRRILYTQRSTGDMLRDIGQIKLKPTVRSPGGRILQPKRENSPCNDLQEILRKRYVAMQSSDSRNSTSTLELNENY